MGVAPRLALAAPGETKAFVTSEEIDGGAGARAVRQPWQEKARLMVKKKTRGAASVEVGARTQ
eukprot:1849193-Pyramimonas_sp.AAC.1